MTSSAGTVPDWLGILTERDLIDMCGLGAFHRGADYQSSGRVRSLRFSHDRTITAIVAGSSRRHYDVTISPPRPNQREFARTLPSSACTCPMGFDCKHVVAVLIAGRQLARAKNANPAWQIALDQLIAERPVVETALALRVELYRGKYDSYPRPYLKPVAQGKNGWIKTGAGWRDIEYGYARPPLIQAQRDALLELLYMHRASRQMTYSYGEARLFLDEFGPSVWPALLRLATVGIPLLPPKTSRSLTLVDQPAAVHFNLEQVVGRPARLVIDLRDPDDQRMPTDIVVLGDPGHGYCLITDDQIVLGSIDPPVNNVTMRLLTKGLLEIPEEDLSQFLFSYYPALSRQVPITSRDGSVDLPEISGPRLELHAQFLPNHVTAISWHLAYRVGEEIMRFSPGSRSEVGRDSAAEAKLLQVLSQFEGSAGSPLRHGEIVPKFELSGVQTSEFVRFTLPTIQADSNIDVVLLGEPLPYREADLPATISVGATDTDDPDWFDLSVAVNIGDEAVRLPDLLQALSLGEPELLLDSGTSLRLDAPELKQLRDLIAEAAQISDAEATGLRITPVQAGVWDELVNLGIVTEQSERWRSAVGALLALDDYERPEPPKDFGTTLRPYQLQGYHWLCLLWDLQLGGVLADDMGLGKTVQTLAMAARASQEGTLGQQSGPLLIVAPTSVLMTWQEQAEQFCPNLKIVLLRETQKRGGHSIAEVASSADIVVTSYALFRIEQDDFHKVIWSGLVLDEAQFVKNHQSKTYRAARALPARFKLAITGTPIENSVMDLWSMLSITAPGLFPAVKQFEAQYRRPIESGTDPQRLDVLRRRVRPLMLRRTKETVAPDLPPKTEQTRFIPLSPAHRRIYDAQLNRERQRVLGLLDDIDRNRIAVLKSLTTLRQLSLDASLVGDHKVGAVNSAKVDALVEDLREIGKEGHRALVFSQFTRFLRIVRDRLDAEGITACYLDGRTRDRGKRIAEFNDGDATAFLISLKAGGFGLNLTAADYVYILDPWWNPAAEAQAVDRTHRIGQDKPVMVYRLISTGTIEEKVVALQQRKRDLFTSIVDEGAGSSVLNADDIRDLLARD